MSEPGARVAAVVYNPIKVDLPALEAAVAAEEIAAGWGKTVWGRQAAAGRGGSRGPGARRE